MEKPSESKKEVVQTELKPETFNSIVSGISELKSKMVDQNPGEQEKILKVFGKIFNAFYEKEQPLSEEEEEEVKKILREGETRMEP